MRSNKNKCFLFGGFKKFAILKYNTKTPAFRRTTDPVRGYKKKIRAIPNKVRIAQ